VHIRPGNPINPDLDQFLAQLAQPASHTDFYLIARDLVDFGVEPSQLEQSLMFASYPSCTVRRRSPSP
jgi:hypothetical protein